MSAKGVMNEPSQIIGLKIEETIAKHTPCGESAFLSYGEGGMPVEMITRKIRSDRDERGMLVYGYKFRPVLQ